MPLTRAQLQRLVEVEAALQGVDPAMARAVAQQESGFDPTARSPKGAMGIMQLMPGTAKDLGVDPSDPADNIAGGVKYLAQLSTKYGGDRAKTLAAYNAGMGTVDAYKGVPPFKETRGYVDKIMGMLGPASAEAASPAPAQSRLQAIEAELARRAQRPPTQAPTAEPPSDLTIDIGGEDPTLVQQVEPAQEGGVARALGSRTMTNELGTVPPTDVALPSQRPSVLPSQVEAPVTEGITRPSTMIPLLAGGAGARAAVRLVPEAWRWVGRIAGETLTQTTAEVGGRAMETGKAPSLGEVATTAAWNAAPQVGEEVLRAGARTLLRSGAGARALISDQAAQEAVGLGRRVFHPQDEQVLSSMFEQVRASGVKLDVAPVLDLVTSLPATQRQRLLAEVKRISSPMATALQRTGQPGGGTLKGWDIGELQTMRSELLKRGNQVRTPETQDLLRDLRSAVDEAIGEGMAVGAAAAGTAPQVLKEAQAGWRRLRASDDLQALVTRHTNSGPNLRYQDLNLAALNKSLQGTTRQGKQVMASMGAPEREALQEELATLATRYPFVKIPSTVLNITGGAGLPAAGYQALQGNMGGATATATASVIALALQSPRAMRLFRDSILHGKGRMTTNQLATIVNAIRQESDSDGSTATAAATPPPAYGPAPRQGAQ